MNFLQDLHTTFPIPTRLRAVFRVSATIVQENVTENQEFVKIVDCLEVIIAKTVELVWILTPDVNNVVLNTGIQILPKRRRDVEVGHGYL